MVNTFAMILAAGGGERFGGSTPKQLTLVNGRPMLGWSLARFAASPAVGGILVVAPPGEEESFRTALNEHGGEAVYRIVAGGKTRQESVRLGLQELPEETTHVLVHDAARPCLSADLLGRTAAALEMANAVVPVVPVVDTLVREDANHVDAILDRVNISGVQTPQGFEKQLLLRAHRQAHSRGYQSSDDGSLVLAMGETVRTIPGERTNIKVTYPEDIAIAEAVLREL